MQCLIYQMPDVLVLKEDFAIVSNLYDSHFYAKHNFTSRQGFNVAGALDKHLDALIGRLVFERCKWSFNGNYEYYVRENELESHPCIKEELELTGNGAGAKFMPVHE